MRVNQWEEADSAHDHYELITRKNARIRELEAELRDLQFDPPLVVHIGESLIHAAARRIRELEGVLREIAEHPHLRYKNTRNVTKLVDIRLNRKPYRMGHCDGHRCCAEIAKKALSHD